MEGWIKIHRKLLDWEWYKDNNVKIVFLHLLLTANHKEQNWQGITILRGQVLTSIRHLAEETNLTIQQTRNTLNKLKSTHEITIKTTSKYSLITIEKYSDYQCTEKENNTPINTQTNNQITHEPTTNKNIKNDKNNIYLFLLNKYKRQQKNDFNEYMRRASQMRKEEQWDLLDEEQQRLLMSEI